jgi:hypothetical protein
MAGLAHPENEIHVEDDGTIVITNNSVFMKNEQRFKLDEEYEEMNPNIKKKFKVKFLCSIRKYIVYFCIHALVCIEQSSV